MTKRPAATPEFSRPVTVASLRPGGERLAIEATEGERDALARRFGIEGVRALSAELDLVPKPGGTVSMRGRVRAVLDRTCVVTLEPLTETIDTPLSLLFRPEGEDADEIALDVGEEDEEPFQGGVIDAGEAAAQTVALALDPWPRAAGASLPDGPRQ
jgi:hypothetical protein